MSDGAIRDAVQGDPPLHPELYPALLVDAVARAPERIRIVIGGPSMGTTTVLAAVAARMPRCIAMSARRDPVAAGDAIAAWAAGSSPPICIDNIDEIIGDLTVQQHLIAVQDARSSAVLGGFFSIERVRAQYRADAAKAHAARQPGVLSPTDLWWQKSYVTYLNPWGYPRAKRDSWDKLCTDSVYERLVHDLEKPDSPTEDPQQSARDKPLRRASSAPGGSKELRRSSEASRKAHDDARKPATAGRARQLSEDAMDAIRSAAKALVKVSGGHPTLLGLGYRWLIGWLAVETAPDVAELEELLTVALHSASFDTFTRAARAVLRETREGFDALLELARSPAERPENLPHADLLRASGLVREVHDRGVAVWELVHLQAGAALRYVERQVPDAGGDRAQPAKPPPLRRVRIRPDPRQRDPSQPSIGFIERADDGSSVLTLGQTQWKLLWLLVQAGGNAVPVAELARALAEEGQPEKASAVNPGLQRLRDALRKVGLADLVYNQHGAGYAIDMSRVEIG